jgi:hypothetical protein
MGDCSSYGVENMPLCEFKEDRCESTILNWRRFALEETISKKGKPLKKLILQYKRTPPDEFLDYLKPKLQYFVMHNFVALWQTV